MPFPTNMARVVWEFNWQPSGAGGPIEIQDFGMWGHIADPAAPPFPGWKNVVDGLSQRGANAWATNMTAANFSNAVRFSRCIAYHYDQGHNKPPLDRGESGGTQGVPWLGTGDVLPPQLSLVTSLYTFEPGTYAPNPARRRGRIYLPTPAAGVLGSDGRLSSGYVGTFMDDLEGFFSDLVGTFDNIHFEPMVSSDVVDIGAGRQQMANPISFYRLGRTIDTQRRRRNKLPEQYTNAAFPTNP